MRDGVSPRTPAHAHVASLRVALRVLWSGQCPAASTLTGGILHPVRTTAGQLVDAAAAAADRYALEGAALTTDVAPGLRGTRTQRVCDIERPRRNGEQALNQDHRATRTREYEIGGRAFDSTSMSVPPPAPLHVRISASPDERTSLIRLWGVKAFAATDGGMLMMAQ